MRLSISVIGVLLVALLSACSTTPHDNRAKKQAHHTQNGYKNLHITDPEKGFFDFLRMRFLGGENWADHFSLADTVNVQTTDASSLIAPSHSQVTWLGHSMFLLQHQNVNILTDPIFRDRASPTSFAGPKRYTPHPMDYAQLPAINWVVISHNHYDHLDTYTLRRLAEKSLIQNQAIQFAVPLGLKEVLMDNNVLAENIHTFDWWQSKQDSHVKIEALPSQHWSARSLSDRQETLWASWAITINDYKIWFGGDTGYNSVQFKQIGRHLGEVDLALIPIGGYAPRWFMQAYHVNPEEAIKIHKDIHSKFSVGMHWGTFPLTAEAPIAPVEELAKQRQLLNISDKEFIAMDIGQTLKISNQAEITNQSE